MAMNIDYNTIYKRTRKHKWDQKLYLISSYQEYHFSMIKTLPTIEKGDCFIVIDDVDAIKNITYKQHQLHDPHEKRHLNYIFIYSFRHKIKAIAHKDLMDCSREIKSK